MNSKLIEMNTLQLTCELINKKSITPEDAGCQQLMIDYLQHFNFNIEQMPFAEVSNFWATHSTSQSNKTPSPVFLFAGHTDVVPPGDNSKWKSDPFISTQFDDELIGRGAADMKSSLASMLVATKEFVEKHPNHKGTIAFLITSDEEGPFINGTVKVLETLNDRGQQIDYSIVGEPSSIKKLGDQIRIGRRGSLTGTLSVYGIQGHVAYPEQTINAIHQGLKPLIELTDYHWDNGNQHFPPTSFQITSFESGTVGNIVPGVAKMKFNFRYSSEQNDESLKSIVVKILDKSKIDYSLDWVLNGKPFLTESGKLTSAVKKSINNVCQLDPILSTGGGTSDGRFIALTGAEVIELGHCNATIHKINESVKISDLESLSKIYFHILEEILL